MQSGSHDAGEVRLAAATHDLSALERGEVVHETLHVCRDDGACLRGPRAVETVPVHLGAELGCVLGGDEVDKRVPEVGTELDIPRQVEEVVLVAKAFLVDVHHDLLLALPARDVLQHHRRDRHGRDLVLLGSTVLLDVVGALWPAATQRHPPTLVRLRLPVSSIMSSVRTSTSHGLRLLVGCRDFACGGRVDPGPVHGRGVRRDPGRARGGHVVQGRRRKCVSALGCTDVGSLAAAATWVAAPAPLRADGGTPGSRRGACNSTGPEVVHVSVVVAALDGARPAGDLEGRHAFRAAVPGCRGPVHACHVCIGGLR
mmetsp:Transcript_6447/g.18035  ORF Transcript_6447/g.18035 Transcript_6447/m.18035 type:complete len:314 (-) Transcript_6447:342-1283(-)